MLNKASIPAAFQQDAKSQRGLGMIHAPNVRLQDAIAAVRHPDVIAAGCRACRSCSSRPVHGLPEAFRLPPSPGEAMAVRLRYAVGGRTADEDVFAMLGSGNRIPYTGPQGTWYESHRPLLFAHAIGATDGKLQSMYPLLGHTGGSPSSRPSSVTTGPTAQGTTGALTTRPITPMSVRAAAPAGSAWIPRGADRPYLNAGITCLVRISRLRSSCAVGKSPPGFSSAATPVTASSSRRCPRRSTRAGPVPKATFLSRISS